MKHGLTIFFLLAAATLAAQAPTSTVTAPPPQPTFDATSLMATLGQSNVWSAWAQQSITVLGQNQANDEARQTTDEGTINSLNTTNTATQQTLASLQAQLTSLQAQVAALQAAIAPTPTTITVQAESFNSFSGVPSVCVQPGGTGMVTCSAAVGEILTYNVTVAVSASYKFQISAASSLGGTLIVNGTSIGVANTGGFLASQYQTLTGPTLPLTVGMNTITIQFQSAHVNLDYFTLTPQ